MRTTLFAAAALALGLAGGASAATLRVQLNADIRSTNPGVNRDANTDAVLAHVVEGLVAYGENAQPTPMLAESVDLSADGLAYTFKLRPGVTFHNGEPLTAADVLWSWNRYMDPKTDWRCRSEFSGGGQAKVIGVEAPDARTVVMRIEKPSALFLSALARPDCGMTAVLHKASVKADGSWDQPIGTGPFRIAEWKRGEYIRLARFDGYKSWPGEVNGYAGAKRPLVEEARFLIIPDSATAKAALIRGDIDVMTELALAEVKEIRGNPRVEPALSPTMSMTTILFQTRDPLLGNLKLRQAIAAAIDMPQLVGAVTQDLIKPNPSIVPTSSPYYTAVQATGHEYDPAKAKKLLAEAGYKDEPIVMITNKRYPQTYDAAVIAQAMLQAAGLNVILEVIEWGTQLDRYTKGSYQMMAFPYSARFDPSLNFEAVTGPKDKQPRKAWDNPEAQALLEKSMVVSERAERQRLFDELHRRFIADVPMLMLYNALDSGAVGKNVKGFRPWVGNLPRLWEVRVEG